MQSFRQSAPILLALLTPLVTAQPAPSQEGTPSSAPAGATAQTAREEQPLSPLEIARRRFIELADAGDEAGLATFFRAQPELALQVIDADLEASLAVWEDSPEEPDEVRIAALAARALLGARVAARALERPILLDYAVAFTSWDERDKRSFRAAQAVYRRALSELEKGDAQTALYLAIEVRDRAVLIGDWWGVAMGRRAEGRCYQLLQSPEDAQVAFTYALLIDRRLGLAGDELTDLEGLADTLAASGRWARARHAADQGVALARRLGESARAAGLLRRRAAAERALGDEEAAERSEAEAAELTQR